MDLTGKVVVVPVAMAGGEQLATTLASRGATVVLVGADADRAGRLAAAIEAAGAGRPAVFVTDITAASGIEALSVFVSELFQGP